MIELLDYILDDNDNFWIVNNFSNKQPKGYMVYKVSNKGRYNNITKKKYTRQKEKQIIDIPKNYQKVFKPQEFYFNNKRYLTGIWKEYAYILNEIGIKDKNIGIFGSYLIGFNINKDVDFIIYGKENLHKYYKNINYIKEKLKVTSISKEHIEYQYNKHKNKFNKKCDLLEIISRNWSGIQLDNGILSTPRFIDKNNINIPNKKGVDKLIKVNVIDGLYSVMHPRETIVEYNNETYKVLSSIWKFQSFAHKGDILEIYGNVDNENKLIILDDNKYYISYIHKSKNII